MVFMKYPNDELEARPSPEIYRSWARAGIEWGQALVGVGLFAGAVLVWRWLWWRVPAPSAAAWWAGQVAVVVVLGVALVGADVLASRRWGWYQLRLGIVLGACAAAGFFGVKTVAGLMGNGVIAI
jgi:hypothetical protein